GEGSKHPSEPHHTSSDQDEHIHHEQISQSPQHEQTTSQEPTIPSQSHSVITTPRRITRGTIQISQSKVPSPGADESAFLIGDARYGEAFPTVTRLDARQDREKIAKTSAMPHEVSPRVTSLGAANILANRGLRSVFTTASLSVSTASAVVSPAVATASGSFPTAVIFTTASVATPTTRVTRSSRGVVIEYSSLIYVNIPSISKKDKGKGKMIEPEQPSKKKVLEQMSVQLARDLKDKFAQEDQIIREQAEIDSEIARIHAKRELEMMIAKLNRSNEMVAKYLSEYEQAKAGLSHDEKVELIDELLMYQRHLAQIQKYQAQQNKPAINTKRRNFYMSILRSNAGWKVKDLKGMTSKASGLEPTQEQQSEEPKELSEEELTKRIEEDLDRLWSLVKETCSTTEVTDKKAKELWVELNRLYEPDSRDPLWALQRYMHDPLVWRLYDTCGVHHVSTGRGHDILMFMVNDYPLTKGLTTLVLCNKLQVDQYSEMANELLMKIYIIANSPR
nr:hypothetical protein [Tanacetum cinerariifolium]